MRKLVDKRGGAGLLRILTCAARVLMRPQRVKETTALEQLFYRSQRLPSEPGEVV